MRKIPVTIITGFLGSGKTTLIQNLIKNANGKRIAIIVNEFGELGLDGEILKGSGCGCEEDDIVELSNGCLCCTVQEEFLPTMLQLMERKDKIDHIIVETSGLALPKPLLKAFNWPDLKPQITVDAVITVVDSVGQATGEICDRDKVQRQRLADENLDHESSIEELFEDQLACADLVVMSKQDLLAEEQFREVKAVIENRTRANVKILAAVKGDISAEVLLGVGAQAEDDVDNRHSHHESHHELGHDHEHDESVNSVVVKISAEHTPQALVKALQELVSEREIYRIKGLIDVPGKPMRMVIQGVANRFETYFDRKWKAEEERSTRLVVIGEELQEVEIRQAIESKLSPAVV
jgi:cobalamin biosynthesis protein CobW